MTRQIKMDFYSARLSFIFLHPDGKPRKKNLHCDSVIVFRARDFDDAFIQALKHGKEMEYEGSRLVEIVNLDWVGKKIDGAEVASRLSYHVSSKTITPRTKFHPEKSKPEGSF